MGIIIRQSILNTILSYVGVALGFVSTILLFPNILDQDQFGLTRLLISLALVSSQFAQLGMKNIVIRYFPYFEQTKNSRRELLSVSIIVPLAGFILFSLLFLIFQEHLAGYYSEQSSLFREYSLYLLPLVFSMLFFEVLNSYIRALRDSITGSFVNEVLLRIIIILLLIVYYFQWVSFRWFMVLFVAAYVVQPVYLLAYLHGKKELLFSMSLQWDIYKYAKEIGIYGTYAMLGGLSTILVGNIDIIMLGSMIDLENTAVYAIAFYVGSVIAIPKRSIGKIAAPILSGFLKNNKLEEVESLYQRTSLNQIIAGSLLLIGIWANMHNLLDLLPAEYKGAQWVIIVVGFAKLFDMATGINGLIILNSQYYRFDLYTNIFLALLTIVTNYLLIPPYGILGAAFATAFSILIYNLVKYVFVWITFSMQPFRWNALGVLATASGCLLLSFQIPYMVNFFVDVIVRSIIIASVFLAIILMFNLSSDVKQVASETWRRISNFTLRFFQ